MDPKRWQVVSRLFHTAAAQPPRTRDAFLDQACRGDPELRAQVASLLESSDHTAGRLEAAVGAGLTLAREGLEAGEELEGRLERPTIGPYRVLGELGRGGLSTVYLAERADEQFQMQVAIKLVRRGLDTRDVLDRLRQERQILAQLDHAHIAKLLDGGTTHDGLPYLVMEHIEGEPIDRYCDRHRLSIDARLRLLRGVCSAVEYAHRNLVIHRDLKPSNILVTSGGIPKLLDFGIAKLLNPVEAPQALVRTSAGVRLLTPAYASPEQVRGETLSTATDVYSLGVVLYELLTGHRPYRIEGTAQDVVRTICDTEVLRPSVVVRRTETVPDPETGAPMKLTPAAVSLPREGRPERLRRRLAGDLDTITLMALGKEPERRYGSVSQFSEDLGRHLEGLPVRARGTGFSYRAMKFLRRYRAPVSVAAAVMVLVAALVSFYTVRLQDERDRAQLEANRLAQVSQFLRDLFETSDPGHSRGEEITARQILDRAAARISNELATQPQLQADMMDLIGTVYQSLGHYGSARRLLERARDLRKELHGAEHPDVATSLNNLGDLFYYEGKFEAAREQFQAALAMRRRLLKEDHPDVATSLNDLGAALYSLGELGAAEGLLREALDLRRGLFGQEHADVATSLSTLASILDQQGRTEEALGLYRRALEIRLDLYGEVHPDVATSLSNLAVLLAQQGDSEAAEPLYRRVLELDRKLLGEDHPTVADDLYNLGHLLLERGEYEEAFPLLHRALRILRQAPGARHRPMAGITRGLGDLLTATGDYEAAEEHYQESLGMERLLAQGGELWRVARALIRLGRLQRVRGNPAAALAYLSEGVAIRRRERPQHRLTAEAEGELGACLMALKRYEEAEPLLVKSLAALEKLDPVDAQEARRRLEELYEAWGKAKPSAPQ